MHTHSPAPCLWGLSLVFFCSFLFFILPTPFLYTSGAISIAIIAILLPILLFVLIFVKSKSFLKHFLICVLVGYYLFLLYLCLILILLWSEFILTLFYFCMKSFTVGQGNFLGHVKFSNDDIIPMSFIAICFN